MTDDLKHTVFVFENKSDGQIVAAYADQAKKYMNDKYVHIATINPRAWIEANYSKITGSITTDNSQTLINALAKIELLKSQLASELAAHESWQNEHLRVDGEQCRQIRELEAERDALRKDAKRWQVIKTLFRVMSPNIDGNHTWVQSHYGTLRGGNMDQAVDNLIKQVGEK